MAHLLHKLTGKTDKLSFTKPDGTIADTAPAQTSSLALRTTIIQAKGLTPKNTNSTTAPYFVVTLGDASYSTEAAHQGQSPEWHASFDLPISSPESSTLHLVCWDQLEGSKLYVGELEVPLANTFSGNHSKAANAWYKLQAKHTDHEADSNGNGPGEVQLSLELVGLQGSSPTEEELATSFRAIISQGTSVLASSSGTLSEQKTSVSGAALTKHSDVNYQSRPSTIPASVQPHMENSRPSRRPEHAPYAFGPSKCAGVLYLQINWVVDLPPTPNMMKTSFNMDPFVVASLGRKTYRTKYITHSLNPMFKERMVFPVLHHERQFSLSLAIVDKERMKSNRAIGSAELPMSIVIDAAPQPDPQTGLYSSNDASKAESTESAKAAPPGGPICDQPKAVPEKSTNADGPTQSSTGLQPPSNPEQVNGDSAGTSALKPSISQRAVQSQHDPDFHLYQLDIELEEKEKWAEQCHPQITIEAKYTPYSALIQQFFRAMLKQYDTDDKGIISKVEMTTMLDNLGSTLSEKTIDGFFSRFETGNRGEEGAETITIDQAVQCLEEALRQHPRKANVNGSKLTDRIKAKLNGHANGTSQNKESIGSGISTTDGTGVSTIQQNANGEAGESGETLEADELSNGSQNEHVIEIRQCPICGQPKLDERSDEDIVAHIATCASSNWKKLNNIVMSGFVTSSQAQRGWYSKIVNKITNGGYAVGANSANILVQDRITGQINEERMSIYIRLGIRLLYKGLQTKDMERQQIRRLLKSLSIKQGVKYDDPASAKEIESFIEFHQLDMSEVLLPTREFKSFNEFFYRALKPGARLSAAPDNPAIVVSAADCRLVVYNTVTEATRVWVKGRQFSIKRLLGNAYPEDAERFTNGAMGIWRLAPQDYHRFHVPVDGVLGEPKLIEGEYYTVNPMAIRSALDVYGENVRVIVPIDSIAHGRVMYVCVGAMMVGSTVITAKAGQKVKKGDELGYFKFGGSTVILLFEPGMVQFDQDLVDNSESALETLVRVGMSIGHSPGVPEFVDTTKPARHNISIEAKREGQRRIEGSLAPTRKNIM